VRVGIVMFTIPFVFAWYPEILLIEEAVTITNAAGQRALIEGYTGQVEWGHLGLLLGRLVLSLYLVSSALAGFDRFKVSKSEVGLRIAIAILVLWKTPLLMTVGLVGAAALLGWHHVLKGRIVKAAAT